MPSVEEIEAMEASWPDYKDTVEVLRRPAYLSARASDAHCDPAQWVEEHIGEDVKHVAAAEATPCAHLEP